MSENESFDFDCPHCEQRLRVPADARGKQIRCPDCSNTITVPGPTGITEAAPRPQAASSSPTDITDESPRATSSQPRRRADPYGDDDRDRDRDWRRERDRDDDDFPSDLPVRRRGSTGGGLTAAAICMLLISGLGLLLDLFNIAYVFVGPEPVIDPQAPAFLQEMQRGAKNPVQVGSQGFFALTAIICILGAIQMLRRKTWGLCLAASILSMIHLGSFCCVLGLPVGIWSLVMLLNSDVKESFS